MEHTDIHTGREVCRRCGQPATHRIHFGTFYYETGERVLPRPESLPRDLMWLACDLHTDQVSNDLMDAYPQADGADAVPLYKPRPWPWQRLWWWLQDTLESRRGF